MKDFTFSEILRAWKEYKATTVLRVLKDGKWQTMPYEQRKPISATSAHVTDISKVMDFPEYLRDVWTTQ